MTPSLKQIDTGTLDRLTQQRHSLEQHMQDLESQLRETGRHLVAVDEHIRRLRGKDAPARRLASTAV